MSNQNRPVIFFDGVCGLCNGFVDFVISQDKKKIFLFSPLQSDYAVNHLPPQYTKDLTSVVLMINGEILSKTNAVLRVMEELGGAWKLLALSRHLPLSFRNRMYDMVASNRYRIFGKKETCRLPTEDERQRFLI